MKEVTEIVAAIRSQRNSFNLTKQKPIVTLNFHDKELMNAVKEHYLGVIEQLGHASKVEVALNLPSVPQGCAAEVANKNCDVYTEVKVKSFKKIKRLLF